MSEDDKLRADMLEEQVALLREALTSRGAELEELESLRRRLAAAEEQIRAASAAAAAVSVPTGHSSAASSDGSSKVGATGSLASPLEASVELQQLRDELQECRNELAASKCENAALSSAEAEAQQLAGQLERAQLRVSELEKQVVGAFAQASAGTDKAAADKEAAELRERLKLKEQQGLKLATTVQQLSAALETKTKQLAAAKAAEGAGGSAASSAGGGGGRGGAAAGGGDSDEQRLKARLELASQQCLAAQAESREVRKEKDDLLRKILRLEAQVTSAKTTSTEALRRFETASRSSEQAALLGANCNGGLGATIAYSLKDVEFGETAGVTLTDIGMSRSSGCMGPVDRFLQKLVALMTVRADARLFGFGAWVLCHMIYILTCVYWLLPK